MVLGGSLSVTALPSDGEHPPHPWMLCPPLSLAWDRVQGLTGWNLGRPHPASVMLKDKLVANLFKGQLS